MREQTKIAFENIVDVVACSDGGVKFVYFKTFTEMIDKLASEGDKSAEQIIDILIKFNNYLNTAVDNQNRRIVSK